MTGLRDFVLLLPTSIVLTMVWGCQSARSERPESDVYAFIESFELDLGYSRDVSTKSSMIATYNVHWFKDAERLRDDFRACDAVDVWALQEVRCASPDDLRSRLSTVLPAGRWSVAFVRVNRLTEIGTSDFECQAVVSRWPIVRSDLWPLPRAGRKARVALAVWFEPGGRPCLVVNTDHEPSWAWTSGGSRTQVPALRRHLRAHAETPVILCGDFNTGASVPKFRSNESENDWVRDELSKSGFEAAGPAGNTFHSGLLWLRLDHVFVRGMSVEASGVFDGRGSDHRPVWCRVALPR